MDSQAFVDAISKRPGQRTDVQVVRDGRPLVLTVTPRNVGNTGKIGVGIGFYQRYGPACAVVESVRYNIQTVRDTFTILGKIFSRELSAKGALAGPIEIAAQSGRAARTGFKYLVHLMGFISISIAIMNLMPIPILDGGQIFILMVEGVIRRDLSLRLKEIISQVGFVMILLLMFVVIWFDLMKHLPAKFLPGS
jgi:regulator of sigma E protease